MDIAETQLEIMGGDALAQIIRAETDTQITTAKRYPRDFSLSKRKMLSLATLDEETAAGCFYKLNRQGKTIEGPSVRMAEIAISCFGNIKAGARVIANDGKTITAQGFCHDLENNVAVSVEVKRRITDKAGKTYSEDMQVVTGNAACAIAFRNAAYKVVPMALIKPVYEAAKKCAVGDLKTLADRRTAALKYFSSLGVNEKQVLGYLGKSAVDGIDLADVENLIGLSTAIKEGSTTVDEAFSEKSAGHVVQITPLPSVQITPRTAQAPLAEEPVETQPEEPRRRTVAPKATAQEGLRNLMNSAKVEEADLLRVLQPASRAQSLDTLTDDEAKNAVAHFADVLDMLKGGRE
jgi:hypothetical protein